MRRLTLFDDGAVAMSLGLRFAAVSAVSALLLAGNAQAIGLTYVDADDGINGPTNLSPLSAIRLTEPPLSNDGLWNYRSDGGVVGAGGFFKSVYEASGGTTTEDVPEITQTVSSLTPNTSYDVYVAYWQGAQASHNWNVRAGFTSGNLTLFNTLGPSDTFPSAVAGTKALHFDCDAAPLNPVNQQPLFNEAGRMLLLAKIGTTTSSGSGQMPVLIDDLPTLGTGGPSDNRSWFEGVAYVPAGTDVFIAPGDLNFNGGIDPADAHIFLTNLHTDVSSMTVLETYRLGDLDGDLMIAHGDFVAFKEIYNAAIGAGAFEAIAAGVPEPTSLLLVLVCLGILGIAKLRTKVRPSYAYCKVNTMSSVNKLLIACIVCGVLPGIAHAVPVTGWIGVNSQDGSPTAKQLSGLDTNSPVIGEGLDNSVTTGAGQVALYADINGVLDGAADVALASGQKVVLSGSVLLEGIINSQEQFRWGLFYDGAAPFDGFGWLGYSGHNSAVTTAGAPNGGALRAKVAGNTELFAANGSAVNLQNARDGDAFASGEYDFTMAVSRFDDEVFIDASLTNDSGWSQVWSNVATTDPNQVTYNFNRVGFLSGNTMSPDRVTFSNIDISLVAVEALTLQVTTAGPTAGNVRIRNESGVSFDIDYYEISSAAGSLNLAGWNSLDDQESGDPETQGWDQAGGSDANLLSEVNLQSMTTVSPGASLNLGQAFTANATQDLRFFFGLPDGSLARGIVEYVEGGLTGDYNGNGVVDAADYTLWRDTFGQSGAGLAADGDGDNQIDAGDYTVWKTNFGESAGSGALSAAAVPEPATAFLLVMSSSAAGLSFLCRTQRRLL